MHWFYLTDLLATNGKVPKGLLLVVLRSYFDGGNQADSRAYDVVSLAAVSGTHHEWKPFEKDWKKVLRKHHADFLHTTDAVSRNGIYQDWNEDQVDAFLTDCSKIARQHCARATIGNSLGKFGLLPFVITINLKTFVENARNNPHASQNANEACLRQALGEVLVWSHEQAACDACHFFFDQGEPFYGHLVQLLQNKKALETATLLRKIVHRSESDMRHVPALQLADLYAWTQSNRNSDWNPKWKAKLLKSHFRWQWIDETNIHDVNEDHQRNWLSWNLPTRSRTK